MKDLPLNALRAFATIYSTGGVRMAARELGVAHSAVSRHLRELEAWLGVSLTRPATVGGRRGIAFTAQGEALGRASLDGFQTLERAITSVREERSPYSVVLSTTPSFAARWLMPRLTALGTAYPRIELSLHVEQKIGDLNTGDVDLAIRMGSERWSGLRCEPLMDETLYPVMSPEYHERHGRPKSPADLQRLRLLHDRDPGASWALWKRTHGPRTLNVQRGLRFTSSDLLLQAAADGHGVALARHHLAENDLVTGRLVRPIPNLQVDLGANYWIVRPAQARDRYAVTIVIDWLKEMAARP